MGVDISSKVFLGMTVQRTEFLLLNGTKVVCRRGHTRTGGAKFCPDDGTAFEEQQLFKPTTEFAAYLAKNRLDVEDFFTERGGSKLHVTPIDDEHVLGMSLAETGSHRGGHGSESVPFEDVAKAAEAIGKAAKMFGLPARPVRLYVLTNIW